MTSTRETAQQIADHVARFGIGDSEYTDVIEAALRARERQTERMILSYRQALKTGLSLLRVMPKPRSRKWGKHKDEAIEKMSKALGDEDRYGRMVEKAFIQGEKK